MYLFLPNHFDFSFLARLKVHIAKTLEKEPEKFRAETITKIVRNLLKLKQKRKEKETLDLVHELLDCVISRISRRDPFAIKFLPDFCETLNNFGFESNELAHAILDLNSDEVLEFYPSVQILELLVRHDVNIEGIVSRVKTINYSKTPEFLLIRLLLLKKVQTRLKFCFSLSEQNEISVSSVSYICASPFIKYDSELSSRVIYLALSDEIDG